MSKFTGGEWEFLEWPMSFADSTEHWYLVGSPERAVGFIRHEDDARLIAAAPKMYKLLTAVANYKPDIMWDVVSHAKELLLRIDGKEAANE